MSTDGSSPPDSIRYSAIVTTGMDTPAVIRAIRRPTPPVLPSAWTTKTVGGRQTSRNCGFIKHTRPVNSPASIVRGASYLNGHFAVATASIPANGTRARYSLCKLRLGPAPRYHSGKAIDATMPYNAPKRRIHRNVEEVMLARHSRSNTRKLRSVQPRTRPAGRRLRRRVQE